MTDSHSQTPLPRLDKQASTVDQLTRSVDAFVRMIDRLQADYAALEERHAALNAELAEVNERLRHAAAANQRLAANRDRVVAAVTSGIIAVDAKGIIRIFNPAASRLLGLPPDDVLNRHYADVWPEQTGDPATALACVQGADPVQNRRREVCRDGEPAVILSVSTARLGLGPSKSEPLAADTDGAIEIFSDLTPLEKMHSDLARMRTLAALGEMSATIAHEIRNPLGGIVGFAELLSRRTDSRTEEGGMLAKIVAGAHHLNDLVERLLDFAREPELDLRSVDWNEYLTAVVDQYEETARRRGAKLTLVRQWGEGLARGRADRLCLRQAIWNILENAEQAIGDSGHVVCSAETRSDGGLRLQVIDQGNGIDPSIADRVFVPFVTTKKKGTGLGLPTAKKLVEAHGGAISIETKPGEGTTVCLELPPSPEGE
jgi:PAS domain S-box-containing protein